MKSILLLALMSAVLSVAGGFASVSPATGGAPLVGKVWVVSDLELVMNPIAAGTFTMGSENGEPDELPLTRVTFTEPFWLGVNEVTQRQWRAVMGTTPSHFKGDDLPVETVSWYEAMEFCEKLTAREQAAGRLPASFAYKLPTAAQWEYACKGGTTGDYAGELDVMGWYLLNCQGRPHPVGSKRANAWGLHDMHGNVWEWCLDWKINYPGRDVQDFVGPNSGSIAVMRGGSWFSIPEFCRSAQRGQNFPEVRLDFVGFRIALRSVR